jgi:hypothetical protein
MLNLERLYVANVAMLFQTRFKKYSLNGGTLAHQMDPQLIEAE